MSERILTLQDKLNAVEARYDDLGQLLADPAVLARPAELRAVGKERAEIEPLVLRYRVLKRVEHDLAENRTLLDDPDEAIRLLARQEAAALTARRATLEEDLTLLLVPKDPNDEKNIFLEIRAGTGGNEAALFAADLARMYLKYAERRGFSTEIMSRSETGIGGLKEIVILVEGHGAHSALKYESGVHRVQRVPVTETQGRIHTSTVTVAVLPEAEEVEVHVDPGDLRIDVFRSTGPGGQSVNTTDSAVRITHVPTGLVVTCQDEKSQHKNKAKAMRVLQARLLDRMRQEQQAAIAQERRSQVGTGDRSERIRTYNFPQGRVTDHRIGVTLHQVDAILGGDLDPLITAVATHYRAEALRTGRAADVAASPRP